MSKLQKRKMQPRSYILFYRKGSTTEIEQKMFLLRIPKNRGYYTKREKSGEKLGENAAEWWVGTDQDSAMLEIFLR